MSKSIMRDPAAVKVNGIEIVYDVFGDPTAPAMLLVMGLGTQMIAWDEDFCTMLADKGFWVIRFDNRDVGLSSKLDEAGIPDSLALIQKGLQGEPVQAPYLLSDMAGDAAGLLDALGIQRAHVVGVSMGGMIVQEMALKHADRLHTMTSIMSSTGDPSLPPPKPEALALLFGPVPMNRADFIEREVNVSNVFNGDEIPLDEENVRVKAAQYFERGLHPDGTARQLAAVLASGSRREALRSINIPTLVIHGDADPLVPVEGGIDTAEAIPGAELLIIKGMGHSLPQQKWAQITDAIAAHAGVSDKTL